MCRGENNRVSTKEAVLDKDDTYKIKGILILGVILHHMTSYTNTPVLYNQIFSDIGYCLVAVFFMLSGYGMTCSINKKGKESYLKHFIQNKVLKWFLPYMVIVAIYFVIYIFVLQLDADGIKRLILIQGNCITPFSWYLYSLIIFYLIFWISYKITDGIKAEVLITLGTMLYIVVCVKLYLLSYWYVSSFCFVLGVIWANHEGTINRYLKKTRWTLLALTVLAITLGYVRNTYITNGHLMDVIKMMIAILFTMVVVLITFRINLPGKYLKKIGELSFEIYMLHGAVIYILKALEINNYILFTLLSITGAIIISIPMNKLDKKLFSITSTK